MRHYKRKVTAAHSRKHLAEVEGQPYRPFGFAWGDEPVSWDWLRTDKPEPVTFTEPDDLFVEKATRTINWFDQKSSEEERARQAAVKARKGSKPDNPQLNEAVQFARNLMENHGYGYRKAAVAAATRAAAQGGTNLLVDTIVTRLRRLKKSGGVIL